MDKCLHCNSDNVYYSKKKNVWVCEDCGLEHCEETHDGESSVEETLIDDKYWCREMWNQAPPALATAYFQLYTYVEEGNIGCTLFLIRDVFELMIKLPVTILFNGLHELNQQPELLKELLKKNKKISRLYQYSMQLLVTGKWWECVCLASGLEEDFFCGKLDDENGSVLYKRAIQYLKTLCGLMYFKLAGKKKVSMVTWRNRALGHSCFADDPSSAYPEIPAILQMFRTACEASIPFYKSVFFADSKKIPLRGLKAELTERGVYICCRADDNDIPCTTIHNFAAGMERHLACYDGFDRGRAYLLNCGTGERFRDVPLSNLLSAHYSSMTESNDKGTLSEEDIFSDNLESEDLRKLENLLSTQDEILEVGFLYRWLMDAVSRQNKGLLLLSGGRGMGKSTFCRVIDQLDKLRVTFDDEQLLASWRDFSENTAIRVWHFNSEYRSRKDIFIPGLRDTMLTLTPPEENSSSEVNRLKGRLEHQYSGLLDCEKDLRSLYLSECLNDTHAEYNMRTGQEKLLLVFDGIDEISEANGIFSFIPSADMLDDGVYIMLTCRTDEEIEGNSEFLSALQNYKFTDRLSFSQTAVQQESAGEIECYLDIQDYTVAVQRYAGDILQEQGASAGAGQTKQLAEAFSNRFSDLSAYRKLCRMNPKFNDARGEDLFRIFIEQIEANAPSAYVTRIKNILNTLVWAGEPLTIRELAYLSGERYVSYRLLGMMNDLQAFVKVTRTDRGNCYEISHENWKYSAKSLIPYGDIYFRRRCNSLLKEMEEFFIAENIGTIFDNNSEGELWLLTRILRIYCYNWKHLRENWFEEIRIGSVETILELVLEHKNNDRILLNGCYVLEDYSQCLDAFGSDITGIRGSKLHDPLVANRIILRATEVMLRFATGLDDSNRRHEIFSRCCVLWMSLASSKSKEFKKYILKNLEDMKIIATTVGDAVLLHDCRFYIAIINFLVSNYRYALDQLSGLIKEIESLETIDLQTKEVLARAYVYLGVIYMESKDERIGTKRNYCVDFYMKAYGYIEQLLAQRVCESLLITKEDCETWLAIYYEEEKIFSMALEYRERSIETLVDLMMRSNDDRPYVERYYSALLALSKLYYELELYTTALKVSEQALGIGQKLGKNINTEVLERLVSICKRLQIAEKVNTYTEILNAARDYERKKAVAAAEVLEVLERMGEKSIKKIPNEVISDMKRTRLWSYVPSIDFSRDLKGQMSDFGWLLLKGIANDYLISHKNPDDVYTNRDEQQRCFFWIMVQSALQKCHENPATLFWKNHADTNKAYHEVYWILEHFPRSISLDISLEKLMWLKEQKQKGTCLLKIAELAPSEYDAETLSLLRYMLEEVDYHATDGLTDKEKEDK